MDPWADDTLVMRGPGLYGTGVEGFVAAGPASGARRGVLREQSTIPRPRTASPPALLQEGASPMARRSPQNASPEMEKSDPATQNPPSIEQATPVSVHRSKPSPSQNLENSDVKTGVVLTRVTELAMVVILRDLEQVLS